MQIPSPILLLTYYFTASVLGGIFRPEEDKSLTCLVQWHSDVWQILEKSKLSTEIIQISYTPVKTMFPPGIEPGTFCVLDRCDNHYTTETVMNTLKWNQYNTKHYKCP